MSYIIVGLGNPGDEYIKTRHNTGRIVLDQIRRNFDGDDFKLNKKINALVSDIVVGKKKEKVKLVAPETFMNKSGSAVSGLIKNIKVAGKLIVIYDDFQLPFGRIRISYNRSSGGHNGLESIIKTLKTEAFVRIRVGLSPANSKGVAKVPHGEDKIEKFILGKFKEDELKNLNKVGSRAVEAVEMIITESKEKAMSVFNTG